MPDPAPIAIATIRKNTREEIRVSLATYHGTEFVDVRTYVDGPGEDRRPTPKGVAVRPEALSALVEALTQAQRHLEGRG